MATGPNGAVWALTVFDDGSGPALYVGGRFSVVGALAVNNVARLRNGVWSDLGGGLTGFMPVVASLSVVDHGSGPALFAGGYFGMTATGPTGPLVSWRPPVWLGTPYFPIQQIEPPGIQTVCGVKFASTPMVLAGAYGCFFYSASAQLEYEGGLLGLTDGHWVQTGPPGHYGVVCSVVLDDSPALTRVLVGGRLGTGPNPRPTLALWTACQPCYANCDLSALPPLLNVQDFQCFLNKFASGDTVANCDASTTPPVLNIQDFCFLNRFAAGCP